jgi:allantoicase
MDFTELIDLAAERLGGAVLFANDDFFAPKENLLKPSYRFSSRANTPTWENGWTAGSRGDVARPDLTGASSGSA